MRRVADLAIKLSLAVLSPLLVFGAAELGLRLFWPQLSQVHPYPIVRPNPERAGVLEAIPNAVVVEYTPEFGEVEYRTNSLGMRDHREYGAKTDGVFRILALGDSFTWGTGVPYEKTYLRRLEKQLNGGQLPERIEIIKAGVPSYGTRDELEYLKRYGLQLQPDLVLLGFIAEDMLNNDAPPASNVVASDVVASPSLGDSVGIRSLEQLEWRLRHSSHLYNFMVSLMGRGPFLRWFVERKAESSFVLASYPPAWAERWRLTSDYLEQMIDVLRARNIPLAIIVIPQRLQILVDLLQIGGDRFDAEKPSKLIREFGAQHGVPVFDALPRFRQVAVDQELFFPVDGHLNPVGAGVLADELGVQINEIQTVAARRAPAVSGAPSGHDQLAGGGTGR